MNTNSDRHLAQLFVEASIGCASASKLVDSVAEFEAYRIGHQDSEVILQALREDGASLMKKGIQTTIQALAGFDLGHESWGLIKLYYSTYYFLRAALAYDGLAFLRCRNIYTLEMGLNSSPIKRSGKAFRGDHQATIKLYMDRLDGRDILLSQSIEDIKCYDWLRDKREWINYRRREFIDPEGVKGLNSRTDSYAKQITTYCADSIPIYCFDPDYAALALPVKRAQISISSDPKWKSMLKDCLISFRGDGGTSASCDALEHCIIT